MIDDDEFLENDDFFSATFLSIPDSELVDSSISEYSTEIDCQQKCNIIHPQTVNTEQCCSSVEKQENDTVKLDDFISTCDEKEGLEKNAINTTVISSTPLACINKQKVNLIHSLDKVLKGNLCSKYEVEGSLNNKKENCFDFSKVNIKAKSCAKSDISIEQKNETKSCHLDINSFDTELIPRTRKSWKRKFCGPAGLVPNTQDDTLELQPGSSGDVHSLSSVVSGFGAEHQDIVNSQFTPEALQCGPWKTLQADVSSNLHSFSSSENYNIRQILQEASKKRLPKYILIPILFILIKKLDRKKDSAHCSWPIFMDETGEMNGKINKEVMDKYGKEIVEGSAVILRNVKSLCNVLIMNCENLVTIYAADGAVKHLQDLNSVLEDKSSVNNVSHKQKLPPKTNTFNQIHSGVSKNNNNTVDGPQIPSKASNFDSKSRVKNSATNMSNIHNTAWTQSESNQTRNCVSKSSNNSVESPKIPLKASNFDCKSSLKNSAINKSNTHNTAWTQNESNHSSSVKKISSESENVYISDCMDDFDELLGNLDESSFLDQ